MNNTGKILIGITAGAAVGTLLGMMFAPDKGTNLRQRWFSRGKEYLDEARDSFDEMRKGAKDFVQRGKQKAEKIQEDTNAPMM